MFKNIAKIFCGIDVEVLKGQYEYLQNAGVEPHVLGFGSNKMLRLNDVSPLFLLLLLLQEDEGFFVHGSFNWAEVRRRVTTMILEGPVGSGSSLTQQLAKIVFLDRKLSLGRKIKEALLALALEEAYSKEEILCLYINVLRFSDKDVVGVADASKYYFDKTASQIDLIEALFLSCLVRSPGRRAYIWLNSAGADYFPYTVAFEKLFDLLRACYKAFGPSLMEKMRVLTTEEAIHLARTHLFKHFRLQTSEYLAIENRAAVELISLRKLLRKLSKS